MCQLYLSTAISFRDMVFLECLNYNSNPWLFTCDWWGLIPITSLATKMSQASMSEQRDTCVQSCFHHLGFTEHKIIPSLRKIIHICIDLTYWHWHMHWHVQWCNHLHLRQKLSILSHRFFAGNPLCGDVYTNCFEKYTILKHYCFKNDKDDSRNEPKQLRKTNLFACWNGQKSEQTLLHRKDKKVSYRKEKDYVLLRVSETLS